MTLWGSLNNAVEGYEAQTLPGGGTGKTALIPGSHGYSALLAGRCPRLGEAAAMALEPTRHRT
jgi:hypothetical protein